MTYLEKLQELYQDPATHNVAVVVGLLYWELRKTRKHVHSLALRVVRLERRAGIGEELEPSPAMAKR